MVRYCGSLQTGKVPSHEYQGTIHLEIPTRSPFELIKGDSLVLSEKYRDPVETLCLSPIVSNRESEHEIAIKPANDNRVRLETISNVWIN